MNVVLRYDYSLELSKGTARNYMSGNNSALSLILRISAVRLYIRTLRHAL